MLYRSLGALILICLSTTATGAQNASINQTKSQLKQLNTKISALKKTLAKAHNNHSLLHQELAKTEKKIGEGVSKLHSIHHSIALNHHKINALEQSITDLNKQLTAEQTILAKQVRACYEMGEYQPLKWLLNQDSLQSSNRLLTFYQYLVQSRQAIIAQIAATKSALIKTQNKISQKISLQNTLQTRLHHQQKNLERNKKKSTEIISALDTRIQTSHQRLKNYEINKKNLGQLLFSLVSQADAYNNKPFASARHKLTTPVAIARNAITSLNQGLVFQAPEGTAVRAIYSGKVVFSDWLNGYGLLLIIDHGQGFMSLYAHNQTLLKTKGVMVTPGENIAAVGHSGGSKNNNLYFELRQHGKVVPASSWLF